MAAEPVPEPGHLSDQEAIEGALREVRPAGRSASEQQSGTQFWFAPHIVALVLLLGISALADVFIGLETPLGTLLRKVSLGAVAILATALSAHVVERTLISRAAGAAARYHLRQVLRLCVAVAVTLTIVSLISANWYPTLASLGVGSIILGLALQTPLKSFFGWVYIMVRAPYRVGDRIRIDDAAGDVIGVGYLDTTLWEFGGPYLTTDHPSGRLIKFPNSKVLDSIVYNYSWPLFPFVWNEIRFQLGYESDLRFVAETMQAVAEEEIGEEMMERVRTYRELLAETAIDRLTVQDRPTVIFRARDTWIEAILRYVVHPKETGRVRSRLTERLLKRLNEAPDRVLFPAGNSR